MNIYRLSRLKYAKELSRTGASRSGNRWNSKGTEIIYCADSKALALAEVSVHLSLLTLPKDFVMLEISFPKSVTIQILNKNILPNNWMDFPHSYETQKIGDLFVKSNKKCILKVPSAVVPGDYNFLINPQHSDFKKIKIKNHEAFPFDKRMFT